MARKRVVAPQIVQRHTHWRYRLALATVSVVALLASWAAYEHGLRRAGFDSTAAELNRSRLAGQVLNLEGENSALRRRVAVLERSGQIDRQASANIRAEFKQLQDEEQRLREEINLYRGVMAANQVDRGLTIQSFKLRKISSAGRYHYRLVLMPAFAR